MIIVFIGQCGDEMVLGEMIPGVDVLKFEAVGSRITCYPPVEDTDEDYLMLVPDLQKVEKALMDAGNVHNVGQYEDALPEFMSFRAGRINLIVTAQPKFFNKFMLATRLATQFNLLAKGDRIDLFQAILYGRGRWK